MSTKEPPKEVKEMHVQLAEVRRRARGVKESARNLRSVPKSKRLAQLTDETMDHYDSQHPKRPEDTDKHIL